MWPPGLAGQRQRATVAAAARTCGSILVTFEILPCLCTARAKQWKYTASMTLKNAALFALIGTVLLAVLLAAGFLRDLVSFLHGAVAAITLLTSGIHLLASLSMAVFLYVFHNSQR